MNLRSDLRSFLHSLDKETLADLLCEQADRDADLRKRLHAMAGGATDGELAEVSDLLDDAVRAAESVQIASVLDTLRRLLDAGTQADVAPLARHAVDRIIAALADVDDSAGGMRDQLERAVSLYARACAAHPPQPRQLAEWIVRVAFDSPGWPQIRLPEFAQALGTDGIELVRSAVDTVLAEADPEKSTDRGGTAQRLRLEIAEITGDVDTVVRLLSEQLPRLDISLRIVRVLRAAGRHAEAIAHAAQALGNDGAARRGPVVDALERASSRQPAELVRDLLAEDRADEAWRAAGQHPAGDLIPVYRSHVEALIQQRDAENYARAASQLRRLRMLHKRAGTAEEFSEYLAELVQTHKRKRRLLAEIRRARIALPKVARQ
ncbi:hypothetical protein FHU38_004951 [Saccharomonospora amisosensis]|uniref:Uncharacterized protein n=1 Tax=Saccharomonospora amisosensis TaxID=1128677 RepID=A0A7X5UUU6_9PSEU|nr:DUF6880 family protein [Saccharomonospora amisosensis]NIJ14550.1 hypothetical protein [Saccharomonospora amisosensis]